MHGFIKRFADGVYPEEVVILINAFDDAWATLQASGAPFAEKTYAPTAREVIARCIIKAAERGERDRHRLADEALLQLSRQRLSRNHST